MGNTNQEPEINLRDKFSDNREIYDLLAVAREYHATAFPNAARQGCPAREQLISTVESQKLPSAQLRRHILDCSDCFRDFQAIRQTQTGNLKAFASSSNEIKKSKFRLFFYPLAAGFAGAALLLIFAFAFFAWRSADERIVTDNQQIPVVSQQQQPKSDVNENLNRDNPPAAPPAADDYPAKQKIDKAAPKGNRTENLYGDVKSAEPKLIAQDTVQINIKPQPVWRDGQANPPDDKQVTVFKARRIRLQLNIPPEYPAGVYEISFYNELGKKIKAQSVTRERNEKLQTNFDLSAFRGQRLRLCVAPKGEVPDCLPVKITGAR